MKLHEDYFINKLIVHQGINKLLPIVYAHG